MKTMSKTIIVFLVLVFVSSCSPNQKKTVNKNINKALSQSSSVISTKVTGEIINSPNGFIIIYQNSLKDTVPLDRNNHFATELKISSGVYCRVSDGSRSINIFIEPGKDLHINYNSDDIFNSVKFTGYGAEANNYIKDKHLLMLDQTIPLVQLYEYPVNEFKHIIDSIYVINKMFLDEFMLMNSNTSQFFQTTELLSIKYDRASKLIEYVNVNNIVPDARYLRFLNKLSVNDSSLLTVYEYRLFLDEIITYYSNENLNNSNLPSYEVTLIKMQSVLSRVSNQKVIDYLVYSLLANQVKYYGYKNTEYLFALFDNNCKNEEYRTVILKPYEKYLKLTANPKAPQVTMTNTKGEVFRLSDFKGEYIYIDVWATWCFPCRKQFPYFEDLKHRYSHKNIAFISVSIDKNRDDWLEYLTLKGFDDNHFIVEDIDGFLNSFAIKTIPRFITINDKGYLVDINAKAPLYIDDEWFINLPNR